MGAPIPLYDSDDENEEFSSDMEQKGHTGRPPQPIPRNKSRPANLPRAVKKLGKANTIYAGNISRPPRSTAVKPLSKRKTLAFDPKLHARNTPRVRYFFCRWRLLIILKYKYTSSAFGARAQLDIIPKVGTALRRYVKVLGRRRPAFLAPGDISDVIHILTNIDWCLPRYPSLLKVNNLEGEDVLNVVELL